MKKVFIGLLLSFILFQVIAEEKRNYQFTGLHTVLLKSNPYTIEEMEEFDEIQAIVNINEIPVFEQLSPLQVTYLKSKTTDLFENMFFEKGDYLAFHKLNNSEINIRGLKLTKVLITAGGSRVGYGSGFFVYMCLFKSFLKEHTFLSNSQTVHTVFDEKGNAYYLGIEKDNVYITPVKNLGIKYGMAGSDLNGGIYVLYIDEISHELQTVCLNSGNLRTIQDLSDYHNPKLMWGASLKGDNPEDNYFFRTSDYIEFSGKYKVYGNNFYSRGPDGFYYTDYMYLVDYDENNKIVMDKVKSIHFTDFKDE